MGDAEPLGVGRDTGWATAVAITVIIVTQLMAGGSFAAELLLTAGGLWLLGMVFALLLGRSGFYAAGDTLLVVNLLRVHRLGLAEIERLRPETPYENSKIILIDIAGGRRVSSWFAPAPRSEGRRAIYNYVGQGFAEEPKKPLMSARAARITTIVGSVVVLYLLIAAVISGEGWPLFLAVAAIGLGFVAAISIGTRVKR